MSCTFELIEPAAAACRVAVGDGTAPLALGKDVWCRDIRLAAECPHLEVFVAVIPRGLKMRRSIRSSHDTPEAAARTCPAVMNMMFW